MEHKEILERMVKKLKLICIDAGNESVVDRVEVEKLIEDYELGRTIK